MRIRLHDLDKVSQVIEGAVEAGVNQVSPPPLSSRRARDAFRDALQKAPEDATQNARRSACRINLQSSVIGARSDSAWHTQTYN